MSQTIPDPKERALFLPREVDASSMNDLTKKILSINREDKALTRALAELGLDYKPAPILIHIDSYGGYVYQCLGLIGVMKLSTTPIHTVVTGCAMSAAFIIAICGHQRTAYPYATLMYHQVWGGCDGKVQDRLEDMDETMRLQKQLEQLVLSKTRITRDQLLENRSRKKDWYMAPREAKRLGVIDAIAKEQVL